MTQPQNPILDDLALRVRQLQRTTPAPEQQEVQIPQLVWQCQIGVSLAALSGDWDEMFNDKTANLYDFEVPTQSGYLEFGKDTTTYPVRGILHFVSPRQATARALIANPDLIDVQLKVNGEYTDYAATTEITIKLRRGHNIIRFASEGSGTVRLYTRLFEPSDFVGVSLRRSL